MPKVLIVEDSRMFAALIKRRLDSELHFQVFWAPSMAATAELIDREGADFSLALLDLNLPDAPNGEIVDHVIARGIPSVVFTGELSDETRDLIWSKRIVDYVLKESARNLDYILSIAKRISRNPGIKVLVVDDSSVVRAQICELLRIHRYHVLAAPDGQAALEIVDEHPDIKLVITDYRMPRMDGFELTGALRKRFGKEQMAIIGISAHGSNVLSARFMKKGANDYLSKPFLSEEFYSRITNQVEQLEYISLIKDFSNTDHLTGLHNRRYLTEVGEKLFASVIRGDLQVLVAMLDIDNFKAINDTYGHFAGDEVLKAISAVLRERFRTSDVVARYGGEEFCVLATSMDPDHAREIFEGIRERISQTEVRVGSHVLRFTVSIGICTEPGRPMDWMIRRADELLYHAKSAGKNQVMLGTGGKGDGGLACTWPEPAPVEVEPAE